MLETKRVQSVTEGLWGPREHGAEQTEAKVGLDKTTSVALCDGYFSSVVPAGFSEHSSARRSLPVSLSRLSLSLKTPLAACDAASGKLSVFPSNAFLHFPSTPLRNGLDSASAAGAWNEGIETGCRGFHAPSLTNRSSTRRNVQL